MSVTLSTDAKNAACDAVVDLVDAGTAGHLKILDASDNVLVDVTLPKPAFGSASGGVAAANSFSDVAVTTAGTATKFQVTDGTDVIWAGTVTATGEGGDITLTNTSLAVGDKIHLTSWTHSQP